MYLNGLVFRTPKRDFNNPIKNFRSPLSYSFSVDSDFQCLSIEKGAYTQEMFKHVFHFNLSILHADQDKLRSLKKCYTRVYLYF